MIRKTYAEYEREVKKHLTEKRFYHSQCVAAEAVRLARRFGADEQKAETAGILHDIMKDASQEEQLKILAGSGILLSNAQRENPKLWHSMAGAVYAEKALGVEDPEILSAVRFHTSGKKDMTLLEKVLFVADYNSADRDYPEVEVMRALAEKSLEDAMVYGIAWTVGDLMARRLPVAPESIDAYNDALSAIQKRKESEE